MAITGSPDIFVSEEDLSTYVGSMDVTTAALVGDFEWGPVNQITRISNEARLKTYFGLPSDRNFKDWFTAKNYLEYSNSLSLVRVCLNSARNAFVKFNDESINYIPKYTVDDNGNVSYEFGDSVIGNDKEYYMFSPLSDENLTDRESFGFGQNKSVITNFPNYVAFFNEDGIYTVERTALKLESKYNASPKYILDLNADQVIDTANLRKEFASKYPESTDDEINTIVSKKPEETLSNMKLGAAYACVVCPSTVDTKDKLIEYYRENDVPFVYLRKKYMNKLWHIDERTTSTIGYSVLPGSNLTSDDPNYNEDLEELAFDILDTNFQKYFDGTISGYQLIIIANDIELNVKNTTDSIVQEQSIAKMGIPIYAKYPGKYGNRIHVSVINKPAYEAYKSAVIGHEHVTSASNVTKNKAVNIIGNKNLPDDAIVVVVSLKDIATGKYVLKEYGTFSLTKGSTDITGYDNYVFNFFSTQSNYVVFNKEAFENLFAYHYDDKVTGQEIIDLAKGFINIDVNLQYGEDYVKEKLGGSGADYSEVTTTNSNGIDYEINTQMTPVVYNKEDIRERTPLINLVGGVGAYMQGWDLFRNEENDITRVEILMQGGATPEVGQYIIDLAEQRKDCVACVSPTVTECVNVTDPCDRIVDGTGSFYSSSSYAFMDGNYKYQYDNYNDVYRWMPLNADIAGLCAYVDANEEPWMSIGGRQIRNCIKLAFYPSKADRDVLFEHNVNPVTNFSNQGNVIWGDWTRVSNSAFNFFGVRRMFLYVEKNIKQFARTIMFKQNDQLTRDSFVLAVTPFMDGIVGGRGIQEYAVFAGSDVTSPAEMDKGIFRAKFAIKPVRSIRYVDLVFVAVRSDMSVAEVIE